MRIAQIVESLAIGGLERVAVELAIALKDAGHEPFIYCVAAAGPLAPQIEQYLATDKTTAKDRVKLFRLAWDVAGSAFGSRQVLYERFFASDPLTRARAMAAVYPKGPIMERVLDFLGKSDEA